MVNSTGPGGNGKRCNDASLAGLSEWPETGNHARSGQQCLLLTAEPRLAERTLFVSLRAGVTIADGVSGRHLSRHVRRH